MAEDIPVAQAVIATAPAVNVSLFRLYVLRALYLLIAVGQGTMQWPEIVHHSSKWGLGQGALICMLGALAALCLLGLRYPLQMLPLLIFEFTWKVFWMLSAGLPAWLSHQVDAGMADYLFSIGLGVILCPIVIPWRYVFENYVVKPGDRWR